MNRSHITYTLITTTLLLPVMLWAVSVLGNLDVVGTLTASIVNFRQSQSTAPMKTGTALPGTCAVGDTFFKTDVTAGQNIYLCTSTNSWTQVQGGGAGAFDWRPSPQYILMRTDFDSTWNITAASVTTGDFRFGRLMNTQPINNPSGGHNGRPGVFSFSTTTTSGSTAQWSAPVFMSGSDAQNLYAWTDRPWEIVYVFRYPATSDYAASTFVAGLLQSHVDLPPRGVGLRYIAGTDTAFMFFTSGVGTWVSTFGTGVEPDTNWHTVRLRSDGTTIYRMWISLDGGPERSICPSGCDLTLASYLSMNIDSFLLGFRTNEAAQKVIQFDYLHFWMQWGTR